MSRIFQWKDTHWARGHELDWTLIESIQVVCPVYQKVIENQYLNNVQWSPWVMMGNYRTEHAPGQFVEAFQCIGFQVALTLCQFRASQRFPAHTTLICLVCWSLAPASRSACQSTVLPKHCGLCLIWIVIKWNSTSDNILDFSSFRNPGRIFVCTR